MRNPASLIWSWPVVFSALAVASLLFALWRGHPSYRNDQFDRIHASQARWPDALPFNLPGVPPPAFHDLQVLLWGLEVAGKGLDPFTAARPDGANYWFNYPRAWHWLTPLNPSLSWTRPLGLGAAAAFLIAAFFAISPRRTTDALWFVGMLFSVPILEALAHSNNDLLLFPFLVGAAGISSASRPLGGWPALALVAGAALLKLFPACALLTFIDGRRRAFFAASGVALGLIVYFTINLAELITVSARTPRPHAFAFGCQVLASRLLDGAQRAPSVMAALETYGGYARWGQVLPLVSAIIMVVVVLACVWRGVRAAPVEKVPTTFSRTCFRIGAAVYLACFIIGHNYIHRGIFLLLLGAWLLADRSRRPIAWLVVTVAWLGAIPTGLGFPAGQLVFWALAGGLAYWLAYDLKSDVHTTFFAPRRLAR